MLWAKILNSKAHAFLRTKSGVTREAFSRMYNADPKGEVRPGTGGNSLGDAHAVLAQLPPFASMPDDRLPSATQVHALPLEQLRQQCPPETLLYISAAKAALGMRSCFGSRKAGIGIWQHSAGSILTIGSWVDCGTSRLWLLVGHSIVGSHLYTAVNHVLLAHQEWMDDHDNTDHDILDLYIRYWTFFNPDGAYFGVSKAFHEGCRHLTRGPFGGWGPARFGGVPILYSSHRQSFVQFVVDDAAVGQASAFGGILNNTTSMLAAIGQDWQTLAALPPGAAPRILTTGSGLGRTISGRVTEQTD